MKVVVNRRHPGSSARRSSPSSTSTFTRRLRPRRTRESNTSTGVRVGRSATRRAGLGRTSHFRHSRTAVVGLLHHRQHGTCCRPHRASRGVSWSHCPCEPAQGCSPSATSGQERSENSASPKTRFRSTSCARPSSYELRRRIPIQGNGRGKAPTQHRVRFPFPRADPTGASAYVAAGCSRRTAAGQPVGLHPRIRWPRP